MGKIISFYGSDHKTGVTMISQCAAELLSSGPAGLNTVLLHAESGSGCDYSPGVRVSMDGLLPYISKYSLDFSELAEKSRLRRGLSVIEGSMSPDNEGEFDPDMMSFLLEGLAGHFDLVICSCSPGLSNGLGLGALLASEKSYLVMAPRESAVRRFEVLRPYLRMAGLGFDRVILNRFGAKSIYSPSYLGTRLGLDKRDIVTVREARSGDLCEIDERSLMEYREGAFKRDMAALIALIEADCGLKEAFHG